jgi:hypothetical protein
MKNRSDRFSWADLAASVNVPINDPNQFTAPTRFDYARYFGVTPTTIDRWRRQGLSWLTADQVAIKRVGLHPSLIWPSWFPA